MPSDFVSNDMGIEPVVENTQQVEDSLYDRLNKTKPSTPKMLVPEQEASANSTGSSLYEKLNKAKGTVSTEEEKKKQALVSEYFSYGGVRDDAKPNVIHIPLGQERKQSVSVDMDNGSVYLPSLAGWVNEDEYGRTWTYNKQGNKIQLDANTFRAIDPSEASAYTQLKKGGPIKQSNFLGAGTDLVTETMSGLASGLSTVPSYLARRAQQIENLAPFQIMGKPSGLVSGPIQKVSDFLSDAAVTMEGTQQVGSQKGLLGKTAGAAGTVAPGLMLGPASPLYFVPLMSESFRNDALNELKNKIKKDTGITDENSPEFQKKLNTGSNQAKIIGSEAIGTLLGIFPLLMRGGSQTPTVWSRAGSIASEEGSNAAIKALFKSVPAILGSSAKAAAVMSLFRVTQNAYIKGLINTDKPILEHVGDDALIGALFGIAEARGQKIETIYKNLELAKKDKVGFELAQAEAIKFASEIESKRTQVLQQQQQKYDSWTASLIDQAKSEGIVDEAGFREWMKDKNLRTTDDPQLIKELNQSLEIGIDLAFNKPSIETLKLEEVGKPTESATEMGTRQLLFKKRQLSLQEGVSTTGGETRMVLFKKDGVVRYMTEGEVQSYENSRVNKVDKSIDAVKRDNQLIEKTIGEESAKQVTDQSNKTLSELQDKFNNNLNQIENLEKLKSNKPYIIESLPKDVVPLSVKTPESLKAMMAEKASLLGLERTSLEDVYGDLVPKKTSTAQEPSVMGIKGFVSRSKEMTVSEIAKEFLDGLSEDFKKNQVYSGVDLTRALTAATRLGIKAIDAGIKTSAEFGNWAAENFPKELKLLSAADLDKSFLTALKFNPIKTEAIKSALQLRVDEPMNNMRSRANAIDPNDANGTIAFGEQMIGQTLNNIQANNRVINIDAMRMVELVPDPMARERVAIILDKSRQQTLEGKSQYLAELETRDPNIKVKIEDGVNEKGNKKYKTVTNADLISQAKKDILDLTERVSKEEKLTDPKEIELANMYRQKVNDIGNRAIEADVLEGTLYDYVTHVVEDSGVNPSRWAELSESIFGKAMSKSTALSPSSKFAKGRTYETFAELESAIDQSGLRVKTKDIAEIYKDYATSMERAIATKNLINNLKTIVPESGNPMVIEIGPKGTIPFGYEVISHPSFRGFAVAKDLKLPLDFVFKAKDMNMVANAALSVVQAVKRSNVFGSLFHAHALIESAIANVNPKFRQNIKTLTQIKSEAIAKGLREGTPEFDAEVNNLTNIVRTQSSKQALSMIQDAVKKGGSGDKFDGWIKDGLQYDVPEDVKKQAFLGVTKAVDNLIEMGIDPSQRVGRVEKYVGKTVNKALDFATEPMDNFTWDYLHSGLKFLGAEELLNAFLLKNPNATPKEIAAQRRIIAQHINTSFGGLNWFETARTARTKTGKKVAYSLYNPSARRYLQLTLFAPDWTISTLRNFKEAITPHIPELPGRTEGATLGMVKGADGVYRPQTLSEFLVDYGKGGIEGLRNPKTLADYARRTQLRTAAVWATLYNSLNYALTYDEETKKGRWIWENEDPTVIDLPDGTRLQPAKHSMEGLHWLMHPGKTLKNKLALPGKLYDILTDNIYNRTTEEKLKAVAQIPLPFSVRSIVDSEDKWEGAKRAIVATLGFPIYGTTQKEKSERKIKRAIKKQEEQRKKAEEDSKK